MPLWTNRPDVHSCVNARRRPRIQHTLAAVNGLVRVTQGVWLPAGAVDDVVGRVTAVLPCLPHGAVVAGQTAAELHELWLPPSTHHRLEFVLRPDAPLPRRYAGTRRPEVRGRRQRLRRDEVTRVGGLAVTTLERTWLDLAATLPLPELVATGDSALRAGADPALLAASLMRAVGRRGVVRARAALSLLDARSRSRPESHLRVAVVTGGLPKPAVNVAVYDENGQWLAEPDLSYDDVRLAIEYNGADHAKVERMRRDITRELDLRSRGGWRTVTFGPAQVFGRPHEAAAIVRELRVELAERPSRWSGAFRP